MTNPSTLAPTLAILCSTALWGTLWIPLRRIHETGLSGSSATTAGFLLPLVVLLPFALGRWRRGLPGGWSLAVSGFWLALSIALYSQALVCGQVARVILLFYLTPVWSTLLARLVLSEPITGRRVITILLGLAGVLVIFGLGTGVPLPRGAADWMGLSSGFAWAVAMVSIDRVPSRPLFDRVFVQFVFLGPVFLLVALIPGAGGSVSLEARPLLDSAPWLLAFGLVWMLPVIGLTLFGASRLDPGRVAIFLMLEIVVGLTTAALLAGEPFGLRELVGAALILGASGAEASAGRPPSAEAVWGGR
ncbi:DMT family transporter [bacterium]|nr:DMT family transporter [bacterium]